MTYLEAAYKVLSENREPLHYRQITVLALEQDMITPTGLTPDATMGSRLYTDTKQEGSQFVRAGRGMFALGKRQPAGIDAQVRNIYASTRKRLKTLLHSMPPDRFEELIHELIIQMGFDENTLTVTPYSGDGGIDVVGVLRAVGLTDVNAAVQAKRWKGNVPAPTITQLRGSLQVHQQGIIITTSDFSKGAQAEASAPGKTRISLINGDELLDLLFKHKVGVQEKTLTVMSVDEEWWGDLIMTDIAAGEKVEIETDSKKKDSSPTGRRPISFVLLGESYPGNSWRSILIIVSAVMAEKHPSSFPQKALTLKGRTRRYYTSDPEGMISPARIPGTNIWVETNLSAKDILTRVHQLLELFGYSTEDISIEFEEI